MAETHTMLIRTLNFGEIEVPDDKVLHFEEGLPGFARIQQFTLLEVEEVRPFLYLQAIGDPPIALLVVDPRLIDSAYQFKLSPGDMADIGVSDPSEASVFVVATIPADPNRRRST